MASSSTESEDTETQNNLSVRFSVNKLRAMSAIKMSDFTIDKSNDVEKEENGNGPAFEVDCSEKKFHGTRKSGTSFDYSNFGSHLSAFSHSFKRSGCSSGYASELGSYSDFDSWGSESPCSSSQVPSKMLRDNSTEFETSSSIEFLTNKNLADVLEAKQESVVEQNESSSAQVNVEKSSPETETKQKNKNKKQKEPEVDVPNPLDKVDCDTWFSEFTYGHLLANIHPPDAVFPIDHYIEHLTRRTEKSWFRRKMPLLFGKSHKTPAEVVKNLREVLILVDKGAVQDKKLEKALEEVSKNVAMIKAFIYGNDATEPSSEHVIQVAQLAQEVYNANILPMLVKLLPRFDFECKKDVGQIFNNLLRRQIGTRSPTVEYLGARPEILLQLVQGYSQPDIALTCGSMLRESIRHDHLAKIILYSDVFYTFFKYVQSEVFDIASDAFSTFKDLTTRHKAISAEFLDANYDVFFGKDQYQSLLNSKNYVTRRQSLKLLGELLLDRHNFTTMTKYISNPDNLKLMMELLRDKSRNIQYEAFHVFKVFVANPNKPKPISDILNRNRDKLVEFLGEFHNDRTDDEQFNDEKAYLIKQIQEMKMSPKEPKKPKVKEGEQPESSEASPSPDQQQQQKQ